MNYNTSAHRHGNNGRKRQGLPPAFVDKIRQLYAEHSIPEIVDILNRYLPYKITAYRVKSALLKARTDEINAMYNREIDGEGAGHGIQSEYQKIMQKYRNL